MADPCFPDGKPINPINLGLLSAFPNFKPTYHASFQPPDQSSLSSETTLQLQAPGGTDFAPPTLPQAQSISDYLSVAVGILSQIIGVAKPVFDIIALIIGIINVLCTLVDPFKVAEAVKKLLEVFVPKILSLIPPFAGVVIALDVAKIIIALAVYLLQEIIPTVELVVENALSISAAISQGNAAAIPQIEAKLCSLFVVIGNQIAMAGPINVIIDIIQKILSAVSEGFCAAGDKGGASDCCSTCPALVANPPAGRATILAKTDEFKLVGTDIVLVPAFSQVVLRTAVAQSNDFGVVRNVPVGTAYQADRPGSSTNPTGTYLEDLSAFLESGTTTFSLVAGSQSLPVRGATVIDHQGNRRLKLVLEGTLASAVNSNIDYRLVADETELYRLQLLNIGCNSDVSSSAATLGDRINADSVAWQTNQLNQTSDSVTAAVNGLDSPFAKIGRNLKPIDVEGLQACLTRLQENPTDSSVITCFQNILENEIENARDLHDRAVCAAASSVTSTFTSSKTTAYTEDDSIELTFTIQDIGGGNIMANAIPNTNATVVFASDFGTVSPTVFNKTTGTYSATITSTQPGTANITAFFITDDVCMQPKSDEAGFPTSKITVTFLPATFRPRRQDRSYIQSLGGRRR
jgi:hypothetical protein